MDPPTAAELVRLGGDPTGFVARDLTVAFCEAADLILTATAEHRAVVLQESPRALKRTFTLLEFAHLASDVESLKRLRGDPFALVRAASVARGASTLDDYDITDPFEQPAEVLGVVVDVITPSGRPSGACVERAAAPLRLPTGSSYPRSQRFGRCLGGRVPSRPSAPQGQRARHSRRPWTSGRPRRPFLPGSSGA